MPPRLACLAILLYWVVAASSLIRRDVLPELGFVRPPDLGTIARAEENGQPSRWSVEVIDNPLNSENRRVVGLATTESKRDTEGRVEVTSNLSFDTGGLLKGTPFSSHEGARLEVASQYRIDPSGNLESFRATVRSSPSDTDDLVTIEGTRQKGTLKIVTRGSLPIPILNQTRTIPYEPRSLVQSSLGPFDRLPGLQVGQRWETRVISPLTGRIETVRVEVARRTAIHWDKSPVPTLEVVHHMSPLSARTWVRPDGVVLRQEVPFPFVKMVLERLPDPGTSPSVEAERR